MSKKNCPGCGARLKECFDLVMTPPVSQRNYYCGTWSRSDGCVERHRLCYESERAALKAEVAALKRERDATSDTMHCPPDAATTEWASILMNFAHHAISEITARQAEREAPCNNREFLGQLVRMVWVDWAKEQRKPKPPWLVPWGDLPEPMREVDRRIGERVAEVSCALIMREVERLRGELATAYATEDPGDYVRWREAEAEVGRLRGQCNDIREAMECPPDCPTEKWAEVLAHFHDEGHKALAEIGTDNVRGLVGEVERLRAKEGEDDEPDEDRLG